MTVKKFFVGVVLTIVMVTVLAMSALLFSARDFQYGLAQLAPQSSGLIDFQRVIDTDQQIANFEAQASAPQGDLAVIEQRLADLTREQQAAETQVGETRAEITGNIAQIEQAVGAPVGESAAAGELDASALGARIMSLASAPGLPPAQQQAVVSLRGQVEHLADLESGLSQHDAARVELEGQQRALGVQVAESQRRIYALQQSVVEDYAIYPRVSREVHALVSMSPLGVSAAMAQGHPAMVSTILVLLMGALGAILYLFPAYLTRAEPVTFAEIAVRLIFGMCAALAFYVIANATIAGFNLQSGVEQASTAAALNPFTVSLIGIIAGVMAEDIAKWIQDRGRGVLQAGGGAPAAPAASAAPAVTTEDVGFSGVNPHGGPNAP
jgi:hypothetical protein